jgi:hypothetical protein
MNIEEVCHMEGLISFFRYAVGIKKQLSVEHIVKDRRTRRQNSGFKNNERKEGTGSTQFRQITVAHHMAV